MHACHYETTLIHLKNVIIDLYNWQKGYKKQRERVDNCFTKYQHFFGLQ